MTSPKVLVLKADGTNCEVETAHAVTMAGGAAEIVPVNRLRFRERRMSDFDALILPGGFSYGDDVSSGKILAVELLTSLGDDLASFVAGGKPILGICNGFQVLVRTGLLPFCEPGNISASLAGNAEGHFECRWVRLRPEGASSLTDGLASELELPVAHGEGRFYARPEVLARIEAEGLVALRYVDDAGEPTQAHPANPNGSANAIAGLTDPSGRVIGLMPHPERFVTEVQHPQRVRSGRGEADGLTLVRRFLALA